jgi:hypothetical protein
MVGGMAATELPVITPRERQGAACCAPAATELGKPDAERLAAVVKALSASSSPCST